MSDPTAQPASGSGRPMTPQERARHAANVRWKKENPLQARIAAIREKRKKKGKGKVSPEQREAQRAAEAQANRAKVAEQLGFDASELDALGTFAAGGDLDPKHARALFDAGLVETNDDGSFRVTATGKQFYNAASRGEAGEARDALASGKDTAGRARTKEEERIAKEDEKAKADKEREAAPKGGGGGGGAAKPSDEEKEQEKQEKRSAKLAATRADLKQKMADGDVGLSPKGFDDFTAFADGGDLSERAAADFASMGLTEGSPSRLTEAGRSLRNAIDKGDMRAAIDAIERGKARKKEGDDRASAALARDAERKKRQAEKNKPPVTRRTSRLRDGIRIETRETKAQTAQERAMFANMGGGGGGGSGGGGKPSGGTGGLWKRNPATGKREPSQGLEKGASPRPTDRAQAEKPKTIDTAQDIVQRAESGQVFKRTLKDDTEIFSDVPREATRAYADRTFGNPSSVESVPINSLIAETNTFEASRVAHFMNEGTIRSEDGPAVLRYKNQDYLQDGHHRVLSRAALGDTSVTVRVYDVSDIEPASTGVLLPNRRQRATKDIAMDYANMLDTLLDMADGLDPAVKAGSRHNATDRALIQSICDAACDIAEMACELGAEEREEEGEEMDDSDSDMGDDEPVKTLPDLTYLLDGSEIKALDGDRIGALAVRFGSEDEPDMSPMKDYFTKSTDFWLDAWDRRPMLYHHAFDEDTADAPRIGTWTKAEVKDEGVWLEGQLDRHHRYYTAIKELVRRGALRLSSDSAPHLVRRSVKSGGAHEVTRWPILAASLTPTPAEPRLTAVSFKALLAELGLDAIDSTQEATHEESERPDEAKALDERTRRLLIELDLLTLETIA